jgi:magnesium chelatase family protein
MGFARVLSRAQAGLAAPQVTVEVHLGSGLPTFNIVGLPAAAVKESRERVRAALATCGFELPAGRITVNLAPADLPKEGGRYDLAVALGILLASQQVEPPFNVARTEFYGELGLTGELKPVPGLLLAALHAGRAGHGLVVPSCNLVEVRAADPGARGLRHLRQLVEADADAPCAHDDPQPVMQGAPVHELADVRGQHQAKRALLIAAAGAHSLLMLGPPGSGKTMLAQRLPGLLPPMSETDALEVAAIRSVAGLALRPAQWRTRPFRSPHHTTSAVALVGGGPGPRPGEVSLAHHGVLFLDELPEFDRGVLEVLREPLESGCVTISRAARQADFPAAFQLIAAMNPCPCGYLGDAQGRCRCTVEQVQRYRSRLSGPLIDRLDLHVEVPRVPTEMLAVAPGTGEASTVVAARVLRARERQIARQGTLNARLDNKAVERFCTTTREAIALLNRAAEALGLSARAYHRILKVARTIADLGHSDTIDRNHLGEAIALRVLDRRA